MTDRELLEMAAKAAVLPNMRIDGGGVSYSYAPANGFVQWNPLADDGDALRLAVKLNIWPVRQYDRPVIAVQRGAAYDETLAEEQIGDDGCAATRRAIARAAAAIGEKA